MYEILSLFSVFNPHLSTTQIRQFSRIVIGLLSMTGRVSMLNLSRWTPEGGSYRTVQRFFNTVGFAWGTLCWVFFHTYLFDRDSEYIVAGDESVVPKSGGSTYGLSRFFSSVSGKTVPGVAFLSLSLVSVKDRRSYPMVMEQVVRGAPSSEKALLTRIGDLIPVRYLVLDGYFGHNNALQMARQCGMHLISKLRSNTVLYFLPTSLAVPGPGRPRLYGERFNPQQIDAKYRVSTDTQANITTEVYQATLRHKKFPDPLNVVCLLKTHLLTQRKSHVLLFSSDLTVTAEKMIDFYSLRFQIEFNFREAKQYWGLDDFMNIKQTPVTHAANLSMFMVNVSAKLLAPSRVKLPEASVLDLKAHYRGLKYVRETLKILPQKPDPIVIHQITEHLGAIGAIHQIPTQPNAP